MKLFTYILFFYLMALITLPSVRAIKMIVSNHKQTSCNNLDSQSSDCEKGNFVMNLNFSPTQFVAEISLKQVLYYLDFYTEKQKSNYEKIFIPKYQDSIWHPPKYAV